MRLSGALLVRVRQCPWSLRSARFREGSLNKAVRLYMFSFTGGSHQRAARRRPQPSRAPEPAMPSRRARRAGERPRPLTRTAHTRRSRLNSLLGMELANLPPAARLRAIIPNRVPDYMGGFNSSTGSNVTFQRGTRKARAQTAYKQCSRCVRLRRPLSTTKRPSAASASALMAKQACKQASSSVNSTRICLLTGRLKPGWQDLHGQ